MFFDSVIRKIVISFTLTICAFGLAMAENTDSLCVGAQSLNADAVVQELCADSLYAENMALNSDTTLFAVSTDADTNVMSHDSVPKHIYSIGGTAGLNLVMNIVMREEKLVKWGMGGHYSLFMNSQANPLDKNVSVYDRVFGFPTLEAGLQLMDLSHTQLHTGNTPYNSTLGLVWAGYIGFRRDIYRNRKWSFGYGLENGISLASRAYDKDNNVDNDMIGQHLAVYFGFGLFSGYRVTPTTEVSLGLEFKHVSNGGTDRPNKGANLFCLTLRGKTDLNRPDDDHGLTFEQRQARLQAFRREPFSPYLYFDIFSAVGFRTMYEEWILRREVLPEDHPLYHDGDLGIHTVWTAGFVPMVRYNQVHASGLGLEYTFAGYTARSPLVEAQMDLARKYDHSKHILSIVACHEVFYKQLSLAMSLGAYVFKKTGWAQEIYEPNYYETIGIRYYPKFFRPFYIGYNVKANAGKAYCMEVKVGMHVGKWRIGKKANNM